jgi:DeoR/GlpR family transcriptional regulator of sugar metabolism
MAESTKDLYPEQRRRQIVQQVNHVGRASVAELSQQFGVSEVTIRGDLQALAESNLLVRTHGGAVPLNNAGQYLSLAVRRQQQIQEKRHIGLAAARLVANGDAIILDSSSTALTIAQALKSHRYLTVITNGLMVAKSSWTPPTSRSSCLAASYGETPRPWWVSAARPCCAISTFSSASSARTASP